VSITGGVVLVVIAAMIVFLVLEGLPGHAALWLFPFITGRAGLRRLLSRTSHSRIRTDLQFIYGTMLTLDHRMIIAVPLAVGAGLVITEWHHSASRVRSLGS